MGCSTYWEKHLPSIEYGVTIGRTVLGPDPLVGAWGKVSREWMRALQMLWMMMSNGSFWQGEILRGARVLYLVSYHLQWIGCIWEHVRKRCFLCTWWVVGVKVWKCCVISGFSIQCCGEFVVCSNTNLHV